MDVQSDDYRKLMLRAEIAALLHDLGKYSELFLCSTMAKKSKKKYCTDHQSANPSAAHTADFFRNDSPYLEKSLAKVLAEPWPNGSWSQNEKIAPLRQIGDLARWHHPGHGMGSHFFVNSKSAQYYPTALYLAMVADSVDSASSKGGTSTGKNGLDLQQFEVNEEIFYLLTPFGVCEQTIPLVDGADTFQTCTVFPTQQKLVPLLEKMFDSGVTVEQLIERRRQIFSLLRSAFGKALAETRIPRNDVSLWQHCHGMGTLFKAMLASHALQDNWLASDERGELAHYKELLGIMGVCWDEHELISRSFRPKEVQGRRGLLDEAVQELKAILETEFCLGNEVFRNRDGIFFLIPSKSVGGIGDVVNAFIQRIDDCFNRNDRLAGELRWQVRYKDIGIQILGLADVVWNIKESGVETLAAGPQQPQWIETWEGAGTAREICPRCGVRPVDLLPVSSGSEADSDEKRICSTCETIKDYALEVRYTMGSHTPENIARARRLVGVDLDASCCRYDLNKLLADEGIGPEEGRLVLVQGCLNLYPFQSGHAFSSILAANPGLFPETVDDQSEILSTWTSMFQAVDKALKCCKNDNLPLPGSILTTLRHLFCDTYLGKLKDARVDGEDEGKKLRNYLNKIVLAAPFDPHLDHDDAAARVVNYALRLHPAPSRLARMWETTGRFTREPMLWCEQEEIPYTPITRDPAMFMVVVSSARAWDLLQHIRTEYAQRFGKVRHLMPLHLSATIFYHKAPLYIAIDAARRFARLGLGRQSEQWQLEARTTTSGQHELTWQVADGRIVRWLVDARLPDGREDKFFTWFWKEGCARHPVHVSELEPGDRVTIHPSTFDYEVLDATVRRYDIHAARPHGFTRPSPRPYPLEELGRWQEIAPCLEKIANHQLKQLITQLEGVHRFWQDERYREEKNHFINDAIRLSAPPESWPDLMPMARDGSFFDLVEWCDLIRKHEQQAQTTGGHYA